MPASRDFATNEALAAVTAALGRGDFDRGAAKKLAAALPRGSPAKDCAVAYLRTTSAEAAANAPPYPKIARRHEGWPRRGTG